MDLIDKDFVIEVLMRENRMLKTILIIETICTITLLIFIL